MDLYANILINILALLRIFHRQNLFSSLSKIIVAWVAMLIRGFLFLFLYKVPTLPTDFGLALQLSVKRFLWDDMAKDSYGAGCLFVKKWRIRNMIMVISLFFLVSIWFDLFYQSFCARSLFNCKKKAYVLLFLFQKNLNILFFLYILHT